MAQKIKWTLPLIQEGMSRFFSECSRYPTAHEIDRYQHLPSSRQLQRKFGGLEAIRLKLKIDIPNFTKGEERRKIAIHVNERALHLEKKLKGELCTLLTHRNVHSQFPLCDDARTRADFGLFTKDAVYSVDVFYAKDKHSFLGCLRHKLNKYNLVQEFYSAIFVQMNPDTTQDEIDVIVSRMKKPLPSFIRVMSLDSFHKWLHTIEPR